MYSSYAPEPRLTDFGSIRNGPILNSTRTMASLLFYFFLNQTSLSFNAIKGINPWTQHGSQLDDPGRPSSLRLDELNHGKREQPQQLQWMPRRNRACTCIGDQQIKPKPLCMAFIIMCGRRELINFFGTRIVGPSAVALPFGPVGGADES